MPSRGYGNEILWLYRENWSQSGTPRGVCGVEAKPDTTRQGRLLDWVASNQVIVIHPLLTACVSNH
ncbi:unnamed protein product [Fusarium venenatum]|uniref:Uncharacterized protein n=1 Tax=Fusarium venenatum TaxID=56646 RepID=A0A2L2U0W2_9HYPO|nr:uncharacterized protein FVRRES_08767 [Fusarium venenatum]CEI68690.1 unnamed protein product [Fusarium venenatum]